MAAYATIVLRIRPRCQHPPAGLHPSPARKVRSRGAPCVDEQARPSSGASPVARGRTRGREREEAELGCAGARGRSWPPWTCLSRRGWRRARHGGGAGETAGGAERRAKGRPAAVSGGRRGGARARAQEASGARACHASRVRAQGVSTRIRTRAMEGSLHLAPRRGGPRSGGPIPRLLGHGWRREDSSSAGEQGPAELGSVAMVAGGWRKRSLPGRGARGRRWRIGADRGARRGRRWR